MMAHDQTSVFEATSLTKKFGDTIALNSVTLSLGAHRVIGLIGRNGGGKTTLIQHMIGLYLPTEGTCETLGRACDQLGANELSRIGVVHQENRFFEWMTVKQHLRYVSSFYEIWDRDLEAHLLRELELETSARVGNLSSGNIQKLGIILAVCHHPELLILDEPVSGLDPIARETLLKFLMTLLAEDENTIVISSHILRDIEKIVDWVVCLDEGTVKADKSLDDLHQTYVKWTVTGNNLPQQFSEPYILSQTVNGVQAQLIVNQALGNADQFKQVYQADITSQSLNLDQLFPILIREGA